MKLRQRIVIGVLGLYLVGLGWGYLRLPWAAIKSLRDYKLIRDASAVSLRPAGISLSSAQRRYLARALPVSSTTVAPIISVEVDWYAVVCARVRSGHYISSTGAERRDCLYLCLFGAWIPLHTYSEQMAFAPSFRCYQFTRASTCAVRG